MSPVSHNERLVRAVWRPITILAVLGLSSVATGCFEPDDGREPPLDRIYFPTGIALSPDGARLYLANSDWDLQFNAGSVQVYDAARLRALLPQSCEADTDCAGSGQRCDNAPGTDDSGAERGPSHWCVDASSTDPCAGLGVQSASQRITSPGLCAPFDNRTPELLLGSVSVGAFATDLLYRPNPGGGGRLFVPVRSDATLHWMDVAGSAIGGGRAEIDCGQGTSGECDAQHRRGDDPGEATFEGDALPIEPFGVDASADGSAILVTHQTEGRVSLFVNDWEQPQGGPRLSYILEGLPSRPVLVSAIPVPLVARLDRDSATRRLGYHPGFWLAFRGTPFIQLLRYFDAVDAPDGKPFLETAFADRLTTTAQSDIRGLAIDDSARTACEASCAPGALDCLTTCAGVALDVYLSNTVPASLLVGHSTSVRRAAVPNDRLEVTDAVAIDGGPSRTVVGQILDERGEPQRRVFVTSFDARSVTIYNPDAGLIESRVLTGRGPTALAIDSANAVGYVAHFTDSYVGIIDLDRRHRTYGTIVRSLGRPSAPRGDD
jgi:DNA-binding beta-propeller fold protein YncE